MSDTKFDVEEAEATDTQALSEDKEHALNEDEASVHEPVDEHPADEQLAGEQAWEPAEDTDTEDTEGAEGAEGADDTEDIRQEAWDTDEEFAEPQAAVAPEAGTTPTSSGSESLIAAESAEAFMERWSQVQTGFIEDPQKAVSNADALLSEVVTAYQQALEQRRTQISGAQADGGTDTEDLRLALLEYRGLITALLPDRKS